MSAAAEMKIDPHRNALDHALALVGAGVLSIDPDGRVWRLAVLDRWGNQHRVPIRRAEHPTRKGYLAIALGRPGTRRTWKVLAHVLVWTHIHGAIPAGLQVNHKDLVKANNEPSNLELVTGSGNIRHSYANGRTRPWSKATEWRPGIPRRSQQQIARLVELRQQGKTIPDDLFQEMQRYEEAIKATRKYTEEVQ
jgi:hypothetical protein